MRWHWYVLAHIYLKLGREHDARGAIQRAIDLMPSEQKFWSFLHALNIMKASRETGRPAQSFYPQGINYNFDTLEFIDD